VNFSDRAPSTDWEPVSHPGADAAEAWFQADGEPLAVAFRVPAGRFEVEDITQLLTVEDLLTAVGIPAADVESWGFRDETHFGHGGTNLEFQRLLPGPPAGESHLTVRVRLRGAGVGGAGEVPPEAWQALDALWKNILGLEATIDNLRLGMGGLTSEMDGAFKRQLNVEEKVNALQSDVLQWTKAKNVGRFVLPRVREFVHRATWAVAAAERKRLEELVENYLKPRVPLADMAEFRAQLEHLQKDRQVLLAQGNAVAQECRNILSEIQRAVSSLSRNAAQRAREKRSAGRNKGKHL
jgi:hypothetical protein